MSETESIVREEREKELEESLKKTIGELVPKMWEKFAQGDDASAISHGMVALAASSKLRPNHWDSSTYSYNRYSRPVGDDLPGTAPFGFRWIMGDVHIHRNFLEVAIEEPLGPKVLEGKAVYRERVREFLETVEEIVIEREHYDAPDQEQTYVIGEDFEESQLHEMYEKRERQGRSLQVIIVARDNDTGTGKTTLAVSLCKKWGDNWGAENATNRAGEYRDFLNNKPEGSVLLADEIGQMFDARRAMSAENVEVSQDWQMIRTKRYKTISTLPGPSFLDKRLKRLGDVMIVCTRRGHGRVYRLKVDDGSGDIFRDYLCNVEWGAMDDDPDYQAVEVMKRDRLKERFEGEETEEETEEIDEATRRTVRNEIIRDLSESGMTQTDLAEKFGLSQPAVSKILREGE